jgi:competence protein ComFC
MNILDLFFPRQCLSCHKIGAYICLSCVRKVELASTICPLCGSFSPYGKTHPSCRNKTPLDGAIAVWRYEGVVRQAILNIKYKFAYDISKELAILASDKIRIENYTLVPIPLHVKRERWRGFNQSAEVGKLVAKYMNLNYREDILERLVNTAPQARLNKSERTRNIRGIFAVNPEAKRSVAGKKIWVFDDVWTTGSTLSEAAKTLKQVGAKEVWGLALAR